jgi:hypothetical protein
MRRLRTGIPSPHLSSKPTNLYNSRRHGTFSVGLFACKHGRSILSRYYCHKMGHRLPVYYVRYRNYRKSPAGNPVTRAIDNIDRMNHHCKGLIEGNEEQMTR